MSFIRELFQPWFLFIFFWYEIRFKFFFAKLISSFMDIELIFSLPKLSIILHKKLSHICALNINRCFFFAFCCYYSSWISLLYLVRLLLYHRFFLLHYLLLVFFSFIRPKIPGVGNGLPSVNYLFLKFVTPNTFFQQYVKYKIIYTI